MGSVSTLRVAIPHRPLPPLDMVQLGSGSRFSPAPDVVEWITEHYLTEGGKLYWPNHSHLRDATLGVLWTNIENRKAGRLVLGQAEMGKNVGQGQRAWTRARAEVQMLDWFGSVPDFIITLDANAASGAEDASFCALIDHELCHCAQATDDMGFPRFNKQTGAPMFAMRTHDVEEFVSVVERFGIEAAGESAVEFVLAASRAPSIAPARIGAACGTCIRLVA